MEEGLENRITGKKDEIKAFIDQLEKENIVIKRSDFLENDKDDGHHIFVTVLPKWGGEKNEWAWRENL